LNLKISGLGSLCTLSFMRYTILYKYATYTALNTHGELPAPTHHQYGA